MTRAEFVRDYAQRSGLPDKWARLGFVEAGSRVYVALPCACGEEMCEGWAMLSNEHVLHHLQFNAPPALRNAYNEACLELESPTE